jgi:hypothetical protein
MTPILSSLARPMAPQAALSETHYMAIEAVGGVTRIEGHVRRAALQHGEDTHVHLKRAVEQDAHPLPAANPTGRRVAGQLVGPGL